MDKGEKEMKEDFLLIFKKYRIKKIQKTKPKCKPPSKPVQVSVGGEKFWVCR